MRPIDQFFSSIQRSDPARDGDYLRGEFVSLTAHVLGREAADGLFSRTFERCRASGDLMKLGSVAAFFLGEDDGEESFDRSDWEDIKETIDEVSGELDIDTLTALMGKLLELGKL